MTTLHERLAALADDAPTGAAEPDLWHRGRQIHRLRRGGSVVIIAVVLLTVGALGATSWVRSRPEPVPAGPTTGVRLPDRFYEPSRWLPSTDSAGPLGRLAAVMGSAHGLVGISAAEGEYRYLDLPGRSTVDDIWGATEIELSADGRRIAYWHGDSDGRVDGVGVYDCESGAVETWSIDTEFGLGAVGLAWVGDQVWFSAGQKDSASGASTSHGRSYTWDLGTGAQSSRSSVVGPSFFNDFTTTTSLVEPEGRRVQIYDRVAPPVRTLRTDVLVEPPVISSEDGRRFVAAIDNDGASVSTNKPRPAVVLVPGGGDRLVSQEIPGLRVRSDQLVAWRDDTHVVTFDNRESAYVSVDIATGNAEILTVPVMNWAPGLHVSQDAWRAPTYAAPEPPHPLNPWLVRVGVPCALVLGAVGLFWWRRRVRA